MSNERLITQVPPRGSPWKTQVKAFIMSEKGGKGERQSGEGGELKRKESVPVTDKRRKERECLNNMLFI